MKITYSKPTNTYFIQQSGTGTALAFDSNRQRAIEKAFSRYNQD